MLSSQKLVDALYEFISENGFDDFLVDDNFKPLTRIKAVPLFLVDHNEAQRLLARNSRVSPSESIPDKALSEDMVKKRCQNSPFSFTRLINVLFDKDCNVKEKLLPLIRSRLNNPNLSVEFAVATVNECTSEDVIKKFSRSLRRDVTKLVVSCFIPDSDGKPKSTIRACIKYVRANHPIIGLDYSTVSDIAVEGFIDNEYSAKKKSSVQPRKIEGLFLYKGGNALSAQEKEDLEKGTPPMLLSLESEMRSITTEFLNYTFLSSSFHYNGKMQEHTLKLMASLVSEGKLLYDDIKILDNNPSHFIDPEDSNKIQVMNVCTASVSFGEYKNVEMKIVFGGTLIKTVNSEEEECYSVEKFYVQLNFKDKSALQGLTGSPETVLRFDDGGRGISYDFLGGNFSRRFQRYCDMKPRVVECADISSSNDDVNTMESSSTENPDAQIDQAERHQINAGTKTSLLWRILEIPASIFKFITTVLYDLTFGKVRDLFSSKPSSTNASAEPKTQTPETARAESKEEVEGLSQTDTSQEPQQAASSDSVTQTIVAPSCTSKLDTSETDGKVTPAKDKGGASTAEHSKQAAYSDSETKTAVATLGTGKVQRTETDGKVTPAKDKGGASTAEQSQQATSSDSETKTAVATLGTGKVQSTETYGKVTPAQSIDKVEPSPAEQPHQAVSADTVTQPHVTSDVMGKDQVALDKTGTSVLKEGDPSTETTVKSSLTGVEPAALAADETVKAPSAPAAR